MFASDPTFVPANLSADDLKLRSILCLDYTTSDYYLKNYVALADIYPDILSVLNDTVTSYQTKDFLPRGVRMQGATLLSNPGVSGFYSDLRPLSLPIGLSYSIDFVAPVVCQITQIETGITLQAGCISSSDPNDILLRIDWPDGVPFQGPLRLTQPWVSGAHVYIQTEPSRFPYADAVNKLQQQPRLSQLLMTYGVLEAFKNTYDPMDKLVIALLVIALSNPSVYVLPTSS